MGHKVTFYPEAFAVNESSLKLLEATKLWLMDYQSNSQIVSPVKFYRETPLPEVLSTDELMKLTQDVIDILERDGWIQGSLHSPTGSHCMLGAAQVASNQLISGSKANAWALAIAAFFGWEAVEAFNDETGRTFNEVIERLREFLYELKGR